jgi:hypothetical protein
MAQAVKHLLCKLKTQISNPSTVKKVIIKIWVNFQVNKPRQNTNLSSWTFIRLKYRLTDFVIPKCPLQGQSVTLYFSYQNVERYWLFIICKIFTVFSLIDQSTSWNHWWRFTWPLIDKVNRTENLETETANQNSAAF